VRTSGHVPAMSPCPRNEDIEETRDSGDSEDSEDSGDMKVRISMTTEARMPHPAQTDEHYGLDHRGVMRACIQEWCFCWGKEDGFAYERAWIEREWREDARDTSRHQVEAGDETGALAARSEGDARGGGEPGTQSGDAGAHDRCDDCRADAVVRGGSDAAGESADAMTKRATHREALQVEAR